MAVKYSFNEDKQFIIEDYDRAKTFASFLPGVAGIDGIPMWAYYVNRGQGLGSFGVKDKNNTIMEFFPAHLMYKNVELQGFRTFIKYNGQVHEIFSSASTDVVKRKMYIEKNLLKVEEVNDSLKLKVTVTYFTVPKESYAGLIRKVKLENLDKQEKTIEILDGLTQVLPYGISNGDYQAMANLMKSWFDVFNLENNIAYYKVRATTSDSAEVGEVNKGNFFLAFSSEEEGLIKPIIDMDLIFGANTSLTRAVNFEAETLDSIYSKKQIPENKVSGGFLAKEVILKNEVTLCSVYGHIASLELISSIKDRFNISYVETKEKEARLLAEELVEETYTKTSSHIFDEYINQCYMDNILRGGYPLVFEAGEKNHVYHVFSRKHGDLEREYNFFSLEPAYYSQGNGNFRDVNQNRRNDVLINPKVKEFNVKQFMDLIQADGYNPLSVKGSYFTFDKEKLTDILALAVDNNKGLVDIFSEKFTPGKLINYISDNEIKLNITKDEFVKTVLQHSTQGFEAEFGEGYWTDHWTYNMDLIENYLNIYPDKLQEFLFERKDYRFFDSAVRVLPRSEKYVLASGKVRQYDAIVEDEEKCHKLNISINDTNWLKKSNGLGEVYETNLYGKLISLAVNKFVNLDPMGIGIEMEANKPGWNDAMNGLPGIFGSSVNEAAELLRVINFIIEASESFDKTVEIYVEVAELINQVEALVDDNLCEKLSDFNYWDKVSDLKESYRDKIRFGIQGKEKGFGTRALSVIFRKFKVKLTKGLEKALEIGNGIYPTYMTYEAEEYEVIEGKRNPVNGYENVLVKKFKYVPIPLFLEAPARMLKSIKDKDQARELYEKIKQSKIYDSKLKMYKTSEPLDDTTYEIGRARAFTAGWLERESIFLHMEYKYLLGLLKAGLYEQYFEDIKTALVPFMDPKVYGRSTLENSSFIASSVNPDEAVHGRGFVSRLTGSTSEMLSMWFMMMAGKKVFSYEAGKLKLELKPILPHWMFDSSNEVSFKFLGNILVTYHNKNRKNTFGDNCTVVERICLKDSENQVYKIKGGIVEGQYAELVREGSIKNIDVYMI
ncbi:cellobiose phosphorylase [Clostridium manihotivorum]|uniref:Cellobiose phosphorylase n=1 Tax=Clostridium manihotivorum TaxID=2320868 RepID=A0A3R5U3V4_9CLOT|nr:cellobiose phosphorylase [Clostridium manihotivorum]QAA30999.1 cellobiose phosphorylase [Clostridium manihotivorum]